MQLKMLGLMFLVTNKKERQVTLKISSDPKKD